MKVLHVTGAYVPSTAYGGPIISTHDLVRAQARLGAEVEVLSTDADGRTRLPAGTAVVDGVRVHYFRTVPLNRHGIAPALIAAMRRVPEFDVVHCHGTALVSTTAAAWAALLCRRSVVVSPHGSLMAWARGKKAWRKRAYGLLDLVPFRRALFHATSDIEAEDVRTLGFRACIVPNAVDVDAFAAPAAFDVRAELGIPRDVPLIAWIGRFDPVKDQAGLVRAFAAVARAYPHAVLALAGDGPCRADLEGLVDQLGVRGRVRFYGTVSDVPGVLAAMDLFVLPSLAEGMSNTVLEAMASGLPILATRVGGNPELVQDGVNGTLVSPQDPAALVAGLTLYLDDPGLRARHGSGSRRRATACFSLDQMRAGYQQLYGDLLHQSRRRIA